MPDRLKDDKSKTEDPSKDPSIANDSASTEPSAPKPKSQSKKTGKKKQTEQPGGNNVHTNAPTNHADANQVGKAEAKAATETGGPLPHGVLPDQVQINQNLGQLSGELNAMADRIEFMLAGTEHAPLTRIMGNARDWVSKELGLVKQKDGTYAPAGA